MKPIDKINGGATAVNKLLFYLEEFFGYEEFSKSNRINSEALSTIILSIENHKGGWIIKFNKIPKTELIIHIVSVFESKLNYDYIYKLVFSTGHSDEKTFKKVAGTCGLNILNVIQHTEYLGE